MYVIAIVRYRKPLEEVLKVVDEHRAYLRDLKATGTLLSSGPLEPRFGGALLLRVPSADASLDESLQGRGIKSDSRFIEDETAVDLVVRRCDRRPDGGRRVCTGRHRRARSCSDG